MIDIISGLLFKLIKSNTNQTESVFFKEHEIKLTIRFHKKDMFSQFSSLEVKITLHGDANIILPKLNYNVVDDNFISIIDSTLEHVNRYVGFKHISTDEIDDTENSEGGTNIVKIHVGGEDIYFLGTENVYSFINVVKISRMVYNELLTLIQNQGSNKMTSIESIRNSMID